MKGVVILGFPKCGTTSLMPYLAKQYDLRIARDGGFYTGEKKPVITRREWSFLPFEKHLENFKHDFGNPEDYELVFIKRDEIERCWSGYNAWSHYIHFSYEDYLDITDPNDLKGLAYMGEVNPIKQVDYWYWIEPWMERYGSEVVKVYTLSGLKNHPDFPWENSLHPPPISNRQYVYTKKILEERIPTYLSKKK